jgi:hypothetical protein
MKFKKLFPAVLSLVLGVCAFAAISATKDEKVQKISAHSTAGLTLVHQGNSESLVGRSAYVIGSSTSHGIRNDGKFGKDGTLLEFVIAEGTTGSKIRLVRSDNGKYLNNPVNGSYSDSPVDRYIDNNYYLCVDSATAQYYRGGKYYGDSTIYYEAYDPEMPTALSLVTKFQVWAAPAKLNLKVNDGWAQNDARFAAYFFGSPSLSPVWADMTLVSGSTKLFEVEVPDTYTQVIFGRMNPGTNENNFNDGVCWNQSNDLTFGSNSYFLMYEGYWGGDNAGIWYSGNENYYVEGDFSEPAWSDIAANKLTWNRLSGQYEIKAFSSIKKDNKFMIYNPISGDFYGYAAEGMTNDYSLFGNVGINIVCNSDTSYDIYFKPQHHTLWIEENATVAATRWATTFLDANCGATRSVWGTLASSYDNLSAGAKGLICTLDHVDHLIVKSSDTVIVQAVQRYDYVLERYGVNDANTDELGYKDFMSRVDSKLTLSSGRIISITSGLSHNSSITLIVTIVAGATLLAFGVFVFIRRRREN